MLANVLARVTKSSMDSSRVCRYFIKCNRCMRKFTFTFSWFSNNVQSSSGCCFCSGDRSLALILLSPSSTIPLQICLAFAALSVIFSSSRKRFIFCLNIPNHSAMSMLDQSMVGIDVDTYTAIISYPWTRT